MKSRQGFVSNSSSMSFVILGEKVSIWDHLHPSEKQNIWMLGGPVGEGWDVFKLTDEMLTDLRHRERPTDLIRAFKVIYIDGPGDSATVDNDLPSRFEVFSIEKSQHSTDDLELFRERYMKKFYEK